VFPYSFGDWGNMDYNIALQWAYCDITGKARWTHTPNAVKACSMAPVDMQPAARVQGRFGNLNYNNN